MDARAARSTLPVGAPAAEAVHHATACYATGSEAQKRDLYGASLTAPRRASTPWPRPSRILPQLCLVDVIGVLRPLAPYDPCWIERLLVIVERVREIVRAAVVRSHGPQPERVLHISQDAHERRVLGVSERWLGKLGGVQ